MSARTTRTRDLTGARHTDRLRGVRIHAFLVAVIGLVHRYAQLTVPRPSGAVRRASLAPRTTDPLTPRPLSWLAFGVGVALAATLVLLAREPSTPLVMGLQYGTDPVLPAELGAYRPTAAGAALVPWFLVSASATLVALAVATAALALDAAPWLTGVDVAMTVAGVALALVLLLWRPPALTVLRPGPQGAAGDPDAEGVRA